MRRIHRIVVLATLIAIGPALAGCENFDPDQLDFLHLNDKKKLPGKREALFPNGVPGVSQGIPPEYMKGYREREEQQAQQANAGLAQPGATPGNNTAAGEAGKKTAAATPVEQQKPKPKPKAKPHARKTKPKPKPAQPQQAAQPQQQPAAAAWPTAQPQQQGNSAAWPPPPQGNNNAAWPSTPQNNSNNAAWPAPPASGNFSN